VKLARERALSAEESDESDIDERHNNGAQVISVTYGCTLSFLSIMKPNYFYLDVLLRHLKQ